MPDVIDYNRPNEKWECGWAKKGFRCHVGPTPKGSCQAKGECEPVKKDDGYHCTRLPQHGGKCFNGPLPDGACSKKFPKCSPRRSLRAKRGLLVVTAVALSFAVLFYKLGDEKNSAAFFSPGSLSFKHSAVGNQCATCHNNAHGTAVSWLFSKAVPGGDSKNCLGCHTMGNHAMMAHSLSEEELKMLGSANGGPEAKVAGFAGKSRGSELSCTTCHKEHRGADVDLTTITKQQCQTCHSKPFDSLEHGHPEFGFYPFNKRTKILFDHTAHFSQHFPNKGGENISCQTCHAPNSQGTHMELNGFENTCQKCHAGQIAGESANNKSIVFLRLPTLDLETLREKGVRIGEWPEDADGPMSPFIKILLSSDEQVSKDLALLAEEEVELDDLSDVEPEVLEAVERLVWSMKELLYELISNGSEMVTEKLEEAFDKELVAKDVAGIMGNLSVDVLRAAANSWFRDLEKEVEKKRGGPGPRTKIIGTPEEELEDEDWMNAGGWYRSNEDFTIRYRPRGHGDEFIKSWVDLTSKVVGVQPSAKEVFEVITHRKESAGACMKCHTVEKNSKGKYDTAWTEGQLDVQWRGKRRKVGHQEFVRFSHSAHLNLLDENGCFTCHTVDKEAEYEKAYKGYDPTVFASNFKSIKKETCAQCHREGVVRDDCTTCHNYHIGSFFSSKEKLKTIKTDFNKKAEESTSSEPSEKVEAEAPSEDTAEESSESDDEEDDDEADSEEEE